MLSTSIPSPALSLTAQVDALFAEWDTPHSPGCSLGVIHNGELIYARGYGMADLERDVPLTAHSVFDIASTSKQFTAMCIALLVEAGALSLEDDIRTYLPELPQLSAPVAIHHLIHHTSGWRDYLELMELRGVRDDDFFTNEDVLELLARQKHLNFNPGEDFLYSNTGYFLLGIIVQRVSGLSLRRFAEENIFKPLGMTNTHFHDNHTEIVKGRAIGYAPHEEDRYRICMTPLDMVGDGSLLTTVEDLYLWDRNFYHNQLGKGNDYLLDLMHIPGIKNDGEVLEYLFGLETKAYRGMRMVCHSGAFVGYRAEMIRFPAVSFSVICLANLSTINPSQLARRVADLYLAELIKKEVISPEIKDEQPTEIAESELIDKVGLYWNPEVDMILELKLEAGRLLGEAGGERVRFEALSTGCFRSLDTPFSVELCFASQSNSELDLIVEYESPIRLTRIQPATLAPGQLAEYMGSYYSDELDMIYRVISREGKLYLVYRNAPRAALKLALIDVFWVGQMILYFARSGVDGKIGEITGFTLNAGRVKGIFFRRMDGHQIMA